MKVGLYFGSFNPVHNGHLIIANYICQVSGLDQVWFVVSPQNPFKKKESLLNQYDRIHLIRLAIENSKRLRASDIEFKLPQPSYTIDTLTHLTEKHPHHQFSILMGSDNLASLHKWKNYEQLLLRFPILVYKRNGFEKNPFPEVKTIQLLDAPLLNISASFIREQITKGISMQYFLPDKVWEYVDEMRYFR